MMLIAGYVKVFSQTGTRFFLVALRFCHFVGLTLLPKHDVGLGANFAALVASRQTKMRNNTQPMRCASAERKDMLVRNTKGRCAKSSPRSYGLARQKGFREGSSHE